MVLYFAADLRQKLLITNLESSPVICLHLRDDGNWCYHHFFNGVFKCMSNLSVLFLDNSCAIHCIHCSFERASTFSPYQPIRAVVRLVCCRLCVLRIVFGCEIQTKATLKLQCVLFGIWFAKLPNLTISYDSILYCRCFS